MLGSSWDGYDIHHIIPLEFGGSNNYSNYVVLNKRDHQEYTTFFKDYWGTNK
ncbi:HNH endonuclease signature motif containing protein [Paenibacillus sp. 2TAB23]|uniref:HNH endonuclease signature motif containing protein n=1 Tax=Paenibacillus sp. 2TAB23 TaxID=3233004 RepID=UPI003F9DA96B